VGVFSFVLAGAGRAAGVMTDATYLWLGASAVATIGVPPYMLRAAPRAVSLLTRLRLG
jgi:hypothetical protein